MVCPKCNKEISENDNFCIYCGYMVKRNEINTEEADNSIHNNTDVNIDNSNSISSEVNTGISEYAPNKVDSYQQTNNGDYNQVYVKPKKMRLKSVLAVSVGIVVFITGVVFAGKYATKTFAGDVALSKIDNLIDNSDYNEAYSETVKFKTKYNFGNFNKKADQRKKLLIQRSEEAYNECINVLNNDSTDNFSQTVKYFKTYQQVFDYSSKKSDVDNLLKSISDYQTKLKELDKKALTEQFLSSNPNFISTLQNYTNEIKAIHQLSDEAINGNNTESKDALVALWKKNYNDYYKAVNLVKSLNESDLYGVILSKEDCDVLQNYVTDGLLPAQTIYQNDSYSAADLANNTKIKASFSEYKTLESKLQELLTSKKTVIDTFNKDYDDLQDQVDDLYNKIKGSSSKGSGKTNL